jgi:TonB family protein
LVEAEQLDKLVESPAEEMSRKGFQRIIKRLFLVVAICALLLINATAQTHTGEQQRPAEQMSAASSPELAEAQKLSLEVVRLFKAGKYDEATPLAKRALLIREKALAAGHPEIVSSLINLGELYLARRMYGEAESYYQRVLAIYEQETVRDRYSIAKILDVLAFLNYMQLDFDTTEKLYQRALAVREEGEGADELEVAKGLFNLAEFYRFKGSYQKAETLYRRALEIRGKTLGAKHADVTHTWNRFSCLYYAKGQMEKLNDIRSQFSFFKADNAAAADSKTLEVLNGTALELPKPDYPKESLRWRISGVVTIKIEIDETGKVTKAEDLCGGYPTLADSALRAARKARFTPTLVSGSPVKVEGVIVYQFKAR